MRPLTLLLLCLLSPTSFAGLEVVGLFKGQAVVRTPQGEEILKVGQTSRSGVMLLAADADAAVVRYQGETQRLSLSKRIGSAFKEVSAKSVSVSADELGQYRVQGFINQRRVSFLVDTGASVVAMSSNHARAIGIDYQLGQSGTVVTAQGEVNARFITLPSVNVGGVKAHNVAATVIEGGYPVDILLGMSFLKQVSMRNEAGVLTLSAR